MKLKLKYFIPFIGMFITSRAYFSGDSRDSKDATQFCWMELYHIITSVILALVLLFQLNILN